MARFICLLTLTLAGLVCPSALAAQSPDIAGELKAWHAVTLTWDGPMTSESASPNPFADYALNVTFTRGADSYVVPGFYAADGDAAETSGSTGNKWRVRFAPDAPGTWNYSVSFTTGTDVAINGGGSSGGFMDGDSGSFAIAATDKTGRDHRGKGRLQYVGEHYLQYAGTGEWFVKAGADAPENTLAYEDFDEVPNEGGRRKNWQPHQQDYDAAEASVYTWQNGKGSELLGAVNYLSGKGVNAFSFLTFNILGDDKNVFPHLLTNGVSGYGGSNSWTNDVHHDRFDVSRMAQWERIFSYADTKGMYLHFKLQETENDGLMDGGGVDRERKLYFRELIARFSHHLALNWNMGEENVQTTQQRKDMATYFATTDPYGHLRVIHTYPGQKEQVYAPLLGSASSYTGLSLQTSGNDQAQNFPHTLEWVQRSATAGTKWVVAVDEPGSANIGVNSDPSDRELTRYRVVWANFMAGGAGTEFYYGYQSGCGDLDCQDHRSRDEKYTDAAIALNFFQTHFQSFLPIVANANNLTADNNDYVLAKAGLAYAVYRPEGGTTTITLPAGQWDVSWYNVRTGVMNSPVTLSNGTLIAPDTEDWTALILPGTCTAGASCNDGDACTNNDVLDTDCNCTGTLAPDADDDGICDTEDACPSLDDALIGTPCDDGDVCTTNDVYRSDCSCSGTSGSTEELLVNTDDDAYLQNGTRVNNTELRIEQDVRVTYLKFNVPVLTNLVTEANLRFKIGSDNGNGNIIASLGNGNSWTEDNLSTGNAPAEASVLGQINTTFATGQTYGIPLNASAIQSGVMTIILRQISGNDIAILSNENSDTDGRPVLQIVLDDGNCAQLPLRWNSFTANANGKDILLEWTTSAEEGTRRFFIEHSLNGQVFTPIGEVASNNISGENNYQLRHDNPGSGRHTYRIMQEDLDGSMSWSPLRSVLLLSTEPYVFPNPVVNDLQLWNAGDEARIQLINGQGRTAWEGVTEGPDAIIPMTGLPTGVYFLRGDSNGRTWVLKVTKQ